MQLQREDARLRGPRFVLIGRVRGLFSVDEMLQVVALGDDDVIVPLVRFEAGLNLLGLPERAHDFDLVFVRIIRIGFDYYLLAELMDNPSTFLFRSEERR